MSEGTPSIVDLVRIRQQVEERAGLQLSNGDGGPPDGTNPDFIKDCLGQNELGDGRLFAALHRGKFLFDASSGCWLSWAGHYWQRDIEGRALAAVEDVALAYAKEIAALVRQLASASDEGLAASLKTQVRLLNRRLDRLRAVRGRANTLTMCATLPEGAPVITGDKLDADPWRLACANGVVDLRSGEHRPGRASDYITKASPTLWLGLDALAPTWETFLLEIMDNDVEMVFFLQRLFGYGITGSIREHVFAVLFGMGRNGKGTLVETLRHVLGDVAQPIQSEMLLDQGRVRSSAGPSADTMSLQGLRLAFASETDQGRKFSAAAVKRLTGGDTLTGRRPMDREMTTFRPQHLLMLLTNHKPRAGADDGALWARMLLVDFPLSFVDNPTAPNERPIDRTLEERLLAEAPGILAWLVKGCLQWQRQGLKPPQKVLAATAEYRRAEDDLAEWLEECCIIDEHAMMTAKVAYGSFHTWYSAQVSEKVPSQKRFGEMLARRFRREKGGEGNTYRYFGVELINMPF